MSALRIEYASAERLAALGRIAEDLNEKSRRRAAEARDLAANLGDAKRRLAALRAEQDHGSTALPPLQRTTGPQIARRIGDDDDVALPGPRLHSPATLPSAVADAERRVAELEAALEAARFDADATQAEWSVAASLHQSCLDFARERGLPLPPAILETADHRAADRAIHGEAH